MWFGNKKVKYIIINEELSLTLRKNDSFESLAEFFQKKTYRQVSLRFCSLPVYMVPTELWTNHGSRINLMHFYECKLYKGVLEKLATHCTRLVDLSFINCLCGTTRGKQSTAMFRRREVQELVTRRVVFPYVTNLVIVTDNTQNVTKIIKKLRLLFPSVPDCEVQDHSKWLVPEENYSKFVIYRRTHQVHNKLLQQDGHYRIPKYKEVFLRNRGYWSWILNEPNARINQLYNSCYGNEIPIRHPGHGPAGFRGHWN